VSPDDPEPAQTEEEETADDTNVSPEPGEPDEPPEIEDEEEPEIEEEFTRILRMAKDLKKGKQYPDLNSNEEIVADNLFGDQDPLPGPDLLRAMLDH